MSEILDWTYAYLRDILAGLREFLATYSEASAAYRGGNLKALDWFPEGCFPPALRFLGAPMGLRRPRPGRRGSEAEQGSVQ